MQKSVLTSLAAVPKVT